MQIHGKGKAKASSNGDAEAGEHTPLNGAEREERRDRIARLALNGKSTLGTHRVLVTRK